MIPNPNDFKEKILNEYRKAFETGLLKSKYLYSTVVERPLQVDDFNVMIDESNELASTVAMKFFARIYLALNHREQKKLLAEAVRRHEEIQDKIEDIFNEFEKMIDEEIEKIESCETEEQLLNVVIQGVGRLVNIARKAIYERIENLPAALYKKIHLAIFKNDFDFSFLVPLILKEQEKKQDAIAIKLAEDNSLETLNYQLVNAMMAGDFKSLVLLQKAIEKKMDSDG